jgi:protein-S-isoprenylcysteine O-methyltransferase Ste14
MNSFELTQIPEYFGIIGFVLWAISERWFQLSKSQQEDGYQRDKGTYWLISLFWYLAVILSIIDANYTHWTTIDLPIQGLRWLGIPLIIIGLIVRIMAHLSLKQQYSPMVKTTENHQLITSAIYTRLRHPAYLGLLMLILGIPLSSWSMLGLGIAVIGGIPAILYRIKIEEIFLIEVFGQQYKEYSKDTWKLIPYLW